MLLWAERDLSVDTLVQNLDLVLRLLPEEALAGQQAYEQHDHDIARMSDSSRIDVTELASSSTPSVDNELAAAIRASIEPDEEPRSTEHRHEECIICFSNPIDCVVMPCGHQICCLECSQNISKCPVCSVPCTFVRVFRA
mmetsp:Transcript_26547/g.43642  ORF Transcript_26547/g.43642 Transcript_26547/m.43642 type:complete len:140 (+) Transcript_26547:890-1309(+)